MPTCFLSTAQLLRSKEEARDKEEQLESLSQQVGTLEQTVKVMLHLKLV